MESKWKSQNECCKWAQMKKEHKNIGQDTKKILRKNCKRISSCKWYDDERANKLCEVYTVKTFTTFTYRV